METKFSFIPFLLFILIVLFVFPMVFAELEWFTTYKIHMYADGSATWLIERRALLETESDVVAFFEEGSSSKFEEFKENVTLLVNEAWLRGIGRDMSATNFRMDAGIYYTAADAYGIIKYYFDWIGFAEAKEDRIELGDVFDGEYVDLHQDDVLIIEYPVGYSIVGESMTKPDITKKRDRTLVWYGPKDFGDREPRATFKKISGIIEIIQQYLLAIISIIVLAGIGTSLWFFRLRRKEEKKVGEPLAKVAIETEDEEGKIVTLLRTAGGRLPQSTVTQQLGFSKSKTSKTLKNLENRGIVRREMIGKRRKMVILINEVENPERISRK